MSSKAEERVCGQYGNRQRGGMMRVFRWVLAWSAGVLAAMGAETVAPKFVDPAQLDVAAILPPPPVAESVAGLADLETVLRVQATRTEEQVAWAKLVERDSVYRNASIVGEWFVAENVPLAAAFFQDLDVDLRAIDREAKKPFLRPRPPKADPRVQPCVQIGTSTGYPSGSAIQAFVWAELLSEVFPEKRDALWERAHRAAWGRVVGGAHYPSDVVAGRLLAGPFLAEGRKSAAFRAQWDAAKLELRRVAAAAR